MVTCKKLLNWAQIINAEGDVRVCPWSRNNVIGNLKEKDLVSILNGDVVKKLRRQIAAGDFSLCPKDNCIYQANDRMDEILVDYDEDTVCYPDTLALAYEGYCNYRCLCCSSYKHMEDTRNNDYSLHYDEIEKSIREVLPKVKHLSANGRGEIFASPRIMKILSEWEPESPIDEVSCSLETNGSLFNEKNWKKIENIGKYNLSVAVTVMSFDEMTYRYLSGTKLPIKNIEENLWFIKGLREKGIVNQFEIATVMQELNFREMPAFTKRALEVYGADIVRIRPIFPGGGLDPRTFWFMDVRNPKHPYYQLYREVMSDSIFQDDRVLLWSGTLDSISRDYPGV